MIASRLLAGLGLARREDPWKDAEILLLRQQLTVLQRQTTVRPKTSRADRALIALLLTMIPTCRHGQLRLLVTPGTVLR